VKFIMGFNPNERALAQMRSSLDYPDKPVRSVTNTIEVKAQSV
jgi:hypothetical protein